jgi:glucose-1-phosphate adenylyltransferase
VLGANVYVGEGAVVEDSVIMSGTVIKAGARVSYSILDENVTVGRGAVVGKSRADAKDITVIGAGNKVEDLSIVEDGAMIS